MLESWIFWTILAATMQSVRTAGQKQLNQSVSAESATLARYLFALPVILGYGAWLFEARALPPVTIAFGLKLVAAGILQIFATILLVRLFARRNFAIGSTYIRLEIVITALLGLTLFGDLVNALTLLGMMVCTAGLILVNTSGASVSGSFWGREAVMGLAAALAFSLTSLLVRDASLSLGLASPVAAAALTLCVMVLVQTGLCLGLVARRGPREFSQLFKCWRLALFIGCTSALGSIGWFTAFTLEQAAVVKTLGQIELIFVMLISYFFFKERPTPREWQGILLVLLGVSVVLGADW